MDPKCGNRTENIRNTYLFVNAFLLKNVIFSLQTTFFDGFNMLMSFLAENDTERSRNYFKKSILNPKHTKFNQNPSFGHVRAVGGIIGYNGSVNFVNPGSAMLLHKGIKCRRNVTWTLSYGAGMRLILSQSAL